MKTSHKAKKQKKEKEKRYSTSTPVLVTSSGGAMNNGGYWDSWESKTGWTSALKGAAKGAVSTVSKSWAPCYETHPALKIGDYEIYGGSCSKPVIKDADLYVGFDMSMCVSERCLPWTEGYEFLYHITDMQAPSNSESFKKLISYLADELRSGKKVHIGCIGGHGRTGTVLAALVTHMTGEKDSIEFVRKHYCKKAVESKSQIEFLGKHFGISTAKANKEFALTPSYSTGGYVSNQSGSKVSYLTNHKSSIWKDKI